MRGTYGSYDEEAALEPVFVPLVAFTTGAFSTVLTDKVHVVTPAVARRVEAAHLVVEATHPLLLFSLGLLTASKGNLHPDSA